LFEQGREEQPVNGGFDSLLSAWVHVGAQRTGIDQIDVDACASQGRCKVGNEFVQRRLAASVGGAGRVMLQFCADIDDAAKATRLHVGDEGIRQQDRGERIDLETEFKIVGRYQVVIGVQGGGGGVVIDDVQSGCA